MKKSSKYRSTLKRFQYTVMLFMLIPMLVLGGIIVSSYSKRLFAELEQRREIVFTQITNDIEEQVSEVSAMMSLYPYKTQLQRYLLFDESDMEPDKYRNVFFEARAAVQEMVSVSRYSAKTYLFGVSNDRVINDQGSDYASQLQPEWYKRYIENGKIEQAFSDDTYITITKKVTGDASVRAKSEEARFDSMLVLQYNKVQFKDDLNIGQYKNDIALNMYSTDGELVFTDGAVAESYKRDKKIMLANMNIEVVFGNKDEQHIISNVISYSIICFFLCLLSAYTVSILCAKFLYKTVRNVFAKMGSAGEPSLELASKNSYIEENKGKDAEEKLAKMLDKMQNMQLSSLQLQINPHFVFNVLNYVNLEMYGDDKAKEKSSQIIILLSKVLSYAMSEPKYSALITEEIQMTKKYIEIENIKTDNKFDVIWDVDKSVLEKKCIKLFLQPIVENSIMHGVKKLKDKRGRIEVTVRQEADGISFIVTDNGKGMTAEELDNVRARLKEGYSDSSKHIGLRNVNERIKMVYGKEYGVTIASDKSGTTVTIKIGNSEAKNDEIPNRGGYNRY